MRNIRAGALRTPVYLGKPLLTKDEAGGEVLSWDEYQTWALIEPTGGREWVTGAAVKDGVDCRITLRLIPGWEPSARWRVRDATNGRLYNLVSAMVLPAMGSAECLAKTVQGNADGR